MNDSSLTRPSLLIRIRDSGNHRAWEEFVQIYAPLIYGYCRTQGLQDADAADVAQEVLVAVSGAIRKFEYDPERGRFRNWLFTVVRSKLSNFFTRPPNGREYLIDASQFDRFKSEPTENDSTIWEHDYQRRLFAWAGAKVQEEVKAETWRAFWLTAMDERKGEDAAAELGLSVGAVYIARSRVLARLRELVASVAVEPPDLPGVIK